VLAHNTSESPARRLTTGAVGNRSNVESVDPEFADSPNDTGGVDDTLRPAEALDPDDVRNADGDEVVDPPDSWAAADKVADEPEGESLDEKLAAEEPESSAGGGEAAVAADHDTELRPDDDLNHIDPEHHGTDEGQVSGTPENGDSIFPVVE
jgi:hypothetical protein